MVNALQRAWTLLVYLFLFAPIVMVVIMSVNRSRYSVFPVPGWSLDWYRQALSDPSIVEALRTSAVVAVIASVLATSIGTLAAVALVRLRFRLRKVAHAAFMSPLIIPEIIIAIALLTLSTTLDFRGGYPIVVAGHVLMGLPFVITVVSARLYGFDQSLEEAARDLGADEVRTFLRVTLPLVLPGVVGGLLLAFTVSFDNFLVTFMVAGSEIVTMPLKIYSMLRFEFSPKIHAASTVIIFITISLLFVYRALTRKDRYL
ncbi:spermidine/putrescine transport system permease protein [Tistlia consotensis]|uniref:Spermidine/putrescine transport system permease protein n=1 Tax=Tistlia consotensis USBA 355 TaxID=560819 RepID=A0A1Y6BDI7_9PROT|nr:ABC transporter permease [Tistlia consotensis]SME98038.1 spermidine/putrescine transport system permease protein [Tistlia consotensis USBA 355]SNR57433.1 spermidine/putrescine transport system permease protein [Tistlia consotensis]